MLVEIFEEVYDNFKLNFYNSIFKGFEDREASLTTTEVFCVEVINALHKPTISELTEFMEVSRQNMSYRISQLEDKGYVKKTQSSIDKREYYLEVTEKFINYNRIRNRYIEQVFKRVEKKYNKEELKIVQDVLRSMAHDLMPEITEFKAQMKYLAEDSDSE